MARRKAGLPDAVLMAAWELCLEIRCHDCPLYGTCTVGDKNDVEGQVKQAARRTYAGWQSKPAPRPTLPAKARRAMRRTK